MLNVGVGGNAPEAREAQAAARTLGLEVVMLDIARAEDIVPAFDSIKDRVDALYETADALLNANRTRINALALDARLPTVHAFREIAESGFLLSYGPNAAAEFRRAGDYVDKILRRAKPGDLPIEQSSKFELASIWEPPRRWA